MRKDKSACSAQQSTLYFVFQITPASVTGATELPSMPEPEGTILKNHLKQVQFEPWHEKWGFHGFCGAQWLSGRVGDLRLRG